MNAELVDKKPNGTKSSGILFRSFRHAEAQVPLCVCELTLHGAAAAPVCFVVSRLLVPSIKHSKNDVRNKTDAKRVNRQSNREDVTCRLCHLSILCIFHSNEISPQTNTPSLVVTACHSAFTAEVGKLNAEAWLTMMIFSNMKAVCPAASLSSLLSLLFSSCSARFLSSSLLMFSVDSGL